MSMTSHPLAFGTINHTEKAGELLGLLWQEVLRLQCDLKDALEPQSPTTADGPAALELSWVPLNKRDLNWHAHATVQLRSMHAALSAAETMKRDLQYARDGLTKQRTRMREDNERLRAALLRCARQAEALKRECGMNPESHQAIRNAQYQSISTTAHIALGTIRGPEGA